MNTFAAVITGYCLFLTLFWAGLKGLLSSRGFPVSLIWPSFRDFDYLNELIRREPKAARRGHFRLLRLSFYAAIALFVILPWALDIFLP